MRDSLSIGASGVAWVMLADEAPSMPTGRPLGRPVASV
jgi:hypothetical protein